MAKGKATAAKSKQEMVVAGQTLAALGKERWTAFEIHRKELKDAAYGTSGQATSLAATSASI